MQRCIAITRRVCCTSSLSLATCRFLPSIAPSTTCHQSYNRRGMATQNERFPAHIVAQLNQPAPSKTDGNGNDATATPHHDDTQPSAPPGFNVHPGGMMFRTAEPSTEDVERVQTKNDALVSELQKLMGEMKLQEKEIVAARALPTLRPKPRDRRAFVRGPPMEQLGFLTPAQSLVMFALHARDAHYWTSPRLASLFGINEQTLSSVLASCSIPVVTSAVLGEDVRASSATSVGGNKKTTVAEYLVSLTNATADQPAPTIGRRSESSPPDIGRPMAFR